MIYVFMANGFEDIEALAPVDILRRAKLDVRLVSIHETDIVESANGVRVICDLKLCDVAWEKAQLLVLPGGLPGAIYLDACEPLRQGLLSHVATGRPVGAICAAPQVLGHLGLLDGKRATCYPGIENELGKAQYTAALIERDGLIVTGKGPGAAMAFGYALLEVLDKETDAKMLREGMMYDYCLRSEV